MNAHTKSKDKPTKSFAGDATVKRVAQEIKGALAKVARSDVPNRYFIGRRIEEIRGSSEKYGRKIVAAIARDVGLTASCLYQYADVARTWDNAKFDDVGRRAVAAGLMFSHFIELAHAGHAGHRDELLKEAMRRGLSVRALRTRRSPKERAAAAAKLRETHDDKSTKIDILERLDREGMTDEVLDEISAELDELRGLEKKLHLRIEMLEEARQRWGEAPSSDESGSDLGKAAE